MLLLNEQILLGKYWFNFYNDVKNWLLNEGPSLLLIILLLTVSLNLLSLSINRIKRILISRATKSEKFDTLEAGKRINTLMGILKGVGKIVLWIVFLMILLKKLGIDIAPILAGAGILGLAVGFGSQELVRDFISGFFILLENQIRTGDVVIINGTSGTVEKIELRTVTLRDASAVVHVFQNGKINSLSNMTKEWSAIVFEIGVAYKEKLNHVIEIMQGVGVTMIEEPDLKEKIKEPLEVFGLDRFDDSAIIIRARLKTTPGDQWSLGREYRKRLKEAFDANNIEIPFPHTTLYWGEKMNNFNVNVNQE